jgi:uncharacterized protein YqgC (DUF456 family)
MGPLEYYLWATLLVMTAVAAWCANLFSMPGNWMTLGLATLFVWLVPVDDTRGISWWTVGVIAVLCVVGEIVEFAAGAAGAAKQGASRRAVMLAIAGTIIGSIAGAIVGIPIPLVGSLLAALGGGAAGAFAGAYIGETWKGSSTEKSLAVSKGALIGRLLGTGGKLAVGALIVMVLAIDAYF